MRTLTQYEVAWNMFQAGFSIQQITIAVKRHRATVYRWVKQINMMGIRKFMHRKLTCKHRRPSSQTPEYIIQKIVDIRNEFGWCGAKIRKELKENHGISLALSTIYRWLHRRFTKAAVGVQRYKKHKALVTANNPREVIEHDTVDLGGNVYAYTAIDIFSKEPSVVIATNLEMATGANAFAIHNMFYGPTILHQSDNGSEFQTTFREAVENVSEHRYSRPYKKNEQSHIENFNKSLRSECFPRGEYQQKDIVKLQKQANEFTHHYINRRWHMGLPNMMTPAQFKEYYKKDPEAATLELAKVTALSHLG
ncbi:MAG: helix-turn-helix domain-containing protein [Rhizobiaceae bacterium]|jgi:IS30 family transposase